MTLASTIEINDGTLSITGIIVAMIPGADNAPLELWRAPDLAGSPDAANAVMVESLIPPPSGVHFVDYLALDGAIWWYRQRSNGNQYGPGDWTDWINLGQASRLSAESVVRARATSPVAVGHESVDTNYVTTRSGRIDIGYKDSSAAANAKQWDWSINGAGGANTLALLLRDDTSVAGSFVFNAVRAANVLSALHIAQNAGDVTVGYAHSPMAPSVTTGFFHIPSVSAQPSGVPTIYGGAIPIVYDTANNALWMYNSGWKNIGGSALELWVDNFGAVGNGIADDAAAFAAAHTALPARGGSIRLGRGKVYRIASALTFSKQILLAGQGFADDVGSSLYASSVILKDGAFDAITLTADNSQIENLQVDGAAANTGRGIVMGAGRQSLRNVTVTKQGGDGVRIGVPTTNCNLWRITNLICIQNTGHGLFIHDPDAAVPDTNGGILTGYDARINGGDGLRCDNTIDNSFYGVASQSNTGYGIHLVGTVTRKCQGQTFWFPYTEANTAGESIMDANADYNVIWGARTGYTSADAVVDNGTNNLILGHDATNIAGRVIKSTLKFTRLRLDATAISGYWDIYKSGSDRGLYHDCVTSTTNVPVWFRNTGGGSINMIFGVDPGGSRFFRAGGAGALFSAGADADTFFDIGAGGASPTVVRKAILAINAPDSGSFRGNARVDYQRVGTGIWLTGIDDATTGGVKAANTEFFWHDGTNYRMALTAAGVLKLDGNVQARVGTSTTVARHGQVLFGSGGQSTTSITEVSLVSFVLKGASLAADYQAVRITASWLVNNTTGGTVKTKFGATDVAVDAPGAAMTITTVLRVVRTGATAQYSTGEETRSSGTLASQTGPASPAETLSGDVTIDFRAFRANSGSATSIVLQYAIIEYLAA